MHGVLAAPKSLSDCFALPDILQILLRGPHGVLRRSEPAELFEEAALAEIAALLRGLRAERDAVAELL